MMLTRLSILSFIFSSMTAYCLADAEIAAADNTQAQIATSKAMMNDPVKQKQKPPASDDVQPAISPTPPAMVKFDNCAMPFLMADYLFWTVRQDNMAYVMPGGEEATSDNTIIKNKVKYPDWEWGSGFRVGLGLNFNHDGWDTYLNYTWFYPESSTDSERVSGDVQALLPLWPVSPISEIFAGIITEASQKWKFKFNNLDWELGRNFFISRYLTLRPFAGLKTAWQKQKQRFFYFQVEDPDLGLTREFRTRNIADFWGIGIRIGVNSAWYVYKKYLSIVADLAFSTLWTNYENKQKQKILIATGETITPIDLTDSYHAIRPVIEADLGMQWEYWFADDAMKFSLRAVWEEQVWWSQNTLGELVVSTPTYTARGGDLFLQGLSIKARFDF